MRTRKVVADVIGQANQAQFPLVVMEAEVQALQPRRPGMLSTQQAEALLWLLAEGSYLLSNDCLGMLILVFVFIHAERTNKVLFKLS
jgi:hypothetical protein